MQSARPYKLLGAAELSYLQSHLQTAGRAWGAEWLRQDDVADVRCVPAAEAGIDRIGPAWRCASRAAAAVYLAEPPGDLPVLRQRLFGPAATQPSALALAAAWQALQALAARCLPGDGVAGPASLFARVAPPEQEARRGSGAVFTSLTWAGGLETRLLLDAEAVRRVLSTAPAKAPAPAAPRPVDPRHAIGQGRVELRAWSGVAELDVATFQSLQPGDVIRLDLRIDEPLRLTVGGQATTRRAYLGGQDGRRALRLTAIADSPLSKMQEGPHADVVE